LPPGRFNQKIIIAGEKHPFQFIRSIQTYRVIEFTGTSLGGSDHINPTQAKSDGDCAWHVMVHVKRNRHQMTPLARNRTTSGDGAVVL
jgi:hypothetical protein